MWEENGEKYFTVRRLYRKSDIPAGHGIADNELLLDMNDNGAPFPLTVFLGKITCGMMERRVTAGRDSFMYRGFDSINRVIVEDVVDALLDAAPASAHMDGAVRAPAVIVHAEIIQETESRATPPRLPGSRPPPPLPPEPKAPPGKRSENGTARAPPPLETVKKKARVRNPALPYAPPPVRVQNQSAPLPVRNPAPPSAPLPVQNPAPPSAPLPVQNPVVAPALGRNPSPPPQELEALLNEGLHEGRVILVQNFELGFTSDRIKSAILTISPDARVSVEVKPEDGVQTGEAIVVVDTVLHYRQLLRALNENVLRVVETGRACIATSFGVPPKFIRLVYANQVAKRAAARFDDGKESIIMAMIEDLPVSSRREKGVRLRFHGNSQPVRVKRSNTLTSIRPLPNRARELIEPLSTLERTTFAIFREDFAMVPTLNLTSVE